MKTVRKIIKSIGGIIIVLGAFGFFYSLIGHTKIEELKTFSQIEAYVNTPISVIFYFKESDFCLANESIKSTSGKLKYITIDNKHIPIVMLDKERKSDDVFAINLSNKRHHSLYEQLYNIELIKDKFPNIQFETVILVEKSFPHSFNLFLYGGIVAIFFGLFLILIIIYYE